VCGIAGILRVSRSGPGTFGAAGDSANPDTLIPEAWLDRLDERLRRRGPDGSGRFRDRLIRADGTRIDVVLVHRRLAILDRVGGHQPMVVESGGGGESPGGARAAVVFNGCIYNHAALRAELASAGRRFTSDHSDTEVIPHLWLSAGAAGFARLEGMFAIGLWDGSVGTLALARDRFGEKPLYFARLAGGGLAGVEHAGAADDLIVFSSDAAGIAGVIASATGRAAPIDAGALAAWLGWGHDAERTPWREVRSLPPGAMVAFGAGAAGTEPAPVLIRSFARPADLAVGRAAAGESPEDQVERLLARAVADRLDADVPVTCFLSGGVDSSLITLMAHRARPGLKAFTVRMPDARLDESHHAAAAAGAIGCGLETVAVSPRAAEDLVELIGGLGLPFGDSSLLPTHWVSRAARQAGLAVALTGDGGDELFLGYDRYGVARWIDLARRAGPLRGLMALAEALAPLGSRRPRVQRLRRLIEAMRAGEYAELLAIFPPSLRTELLGRVVGPMRPAGSTPDARSARDWELGTTLPGDYLRKVDAAAMHVALETRAPMLDSTLADFALRLDEATLLRGGRKGLLRAVARRHLPVGLVDRPKQGFAIPIGDWFRCDFGGLRTLLLDQLTSREPFGAAGAGLGVDQGVLKRMLEDHLGTGRSGMVRAEHGQRLYGLLACSIWASSGSGLSGSAGVSRG
jgi:asparagine synthase (glutamine-hydrolysing)